MIFTPGPLIDIHAYPLLSRDAAAFSLPRDSLVASVIALARLQWALRADPVPEPGKRAHYDTLMHVMVDWLKPLLPAGNSRLGDGFAVWIATGMADFLRSWPDSRAAIDNMSTLTFAELESAMVTVQDLVQESRREGQLATLADYVQLQWGTAAASTFRAQPGRPRCGFAHAGGPAGQIRTAGTTAAG